MTALIPCKHGKGICEECIQRESWRERLAEFLDVESYSDKDLFTFLESELALAKQEMVKRIEKLKKTPANTERESVAEIYNQALQDAKNIINEPKYPCPRCSQIFMKEEYLRTHVCFPTLSS